MLVIALLLLGTISGYLTFRLLGRESASQCDEALGRIRIHMTTNPPPSVADDNGWGTVTEMYSAVTSWCPPDIAGSFQSGEFLAWSGSTLQIAPAGEAPAGPGIDPVPVDDTAPTDTVTD